MQTPNKHLAHNLKALRQHNRWSLEKTASMTGVSKAMLGQIERGESSPTLATLWKLACGFQTSISALIEPELSHQPADNLFRSADRLRHQPTTDQMLVAPLFPFDPQLGFELLELTLPAGYERLSEPHCSGVTEHVIVIDGAIEVLVNEDWQNLTKGEALRFAADKPHGYRNRQTADGKFYNIIHYPPGSKGAS